MNPKKVAIVIGSIFLIIIALQSNVHASSYLTKTSQWYQNLSGVGYGSSAFGDIDNDGDLDLVLSGRLDIIKGGFDVAKIYINNGSTLTESSQWQNNLTGVNYGSLALGDIDNDGDLDLALMGCNSGGAGLVASCNDGGHQIFVYLNNGSTLTESSQWQNNLTKSWKGSLSFGDVDNDGHLDLALTGQGKLAKISKIYINNGSTLTESSQWQDNLTALYESSLAFGDIDNDGDLDLALCGDAGISSERTKIYINNGSTLTESSQWQSNLIAVDWCSIAFGDYNNDNNLDLTYIGHTTADNHYVYTNNGSTFVDLADLTGVYTGSVAFGDYDIDGYLDMIANGFEEYTTLYLYNLSNTNFTTYPQDPESHIVDMKASIVVWVDLDNDTDLDLIETGYGSEGGGAGNATYKTLIYISNRSLTKNNTQPNFPVPTTSATYTNNQLTLIWNNGSDAETNNTGLYYNLKVGNATNNHSIVSGVFGGSSNPTAGYFGNMMQRKNITLNIALVSNVTYYWSVQTIDTGLATSSWSTVQSFTTGTDTAKPSITILTPSPTDETHTSNPYFIFNASVTDADLANVSLYADWTGTMIINETNSSGLNTNYTFTANLTNFNDALYYWYIKAEDNSSNSNQSGIKSIYLDRALPVIQQLSPDNASTWTSSSTVTFAYNVTDTDIANCSLIINGAIDQTETSISEDISQSFSKVMSNADYTWSINCTDYVGYTNNSETRDLTVSYTAPSSPSGSSGGGGSSSSTTPIITIAEPEELFDIDFHKLSVGESKTLEAKQGEIKTFSFNGETEHKITILTITEDSATLLITSNPITIQLMLNQEMQLDINNDKINDFEIKLTSIVNTIANFTITKLEGADKAGKDELGKEALFDVKINIINWFKVVKSGRQVLAQIEAFNVNNIGQVDVFVNYYITKKDDNKTRLAEGSDTLAVEAVASFVRSLDIPYNLNSGIYLFHVDISYKDQLMASSSSEFRIIRNFELIIAIGIFALIIGAIGVYLWRISKKEAKLEKELKKLKESGLKKMSVKNLRLKLRKGVS